MRSMSSMRRALTGRFPRRPPTSLPVGLAGRGRQWKDEEIDGEAKVGCSLGLALAVIGG